MSFDQQISTVVLDMMRSMSYLPGIGLGRRQHGPNEFIAIPDHEVPFGLEFISTKVDYQYVARLRKERVRARLTHTPFDYPICSYTWAWRTTQTHSDGIIGGFSIVQEVELHRLVYQLQLSDGALGTSTSALATPSPVISSGKHRDNMLARSGEVGVIVKGKGESGAPSLNCSWWNRCWSSVSLSVWTTLSISSRRGRVFDPLIK